MARLFSTEAYEKLWQDTPKDASIHTRLLPEHQGQERPTQKSEAASYRITAWRYCEMGLRR